MSQYETLILERNNPVALIRLNRPQAMNALCTALFNDLEAAIDELEADDAIGCIVITGSDKAFAAGADISEMQSLTYAQMLSDEGLTKNCDRLAQCQKPVIAAVAGYTLGGGCELAMMCDFIIAADNARFGQPEITIGTIPGIGGSQRLTRLIGRSKAMDLCLTGRMMDATEAESCGLVSRVKPLDQYLNEALDAASRIAGLSRPMVGMVRDSVNLSLEGGLSQGLSCERQLFKATFALEDQKEGMEAFLQKREPVFKHL